MIIHYWFLSVALLLLWFPRQWLRFGRRVISRPHGRHSDRVERDATDKSLHVRDEFAKPRNWVDFLRALAGAVAVSYLCFEREPGAAKTVASQIFAIKCVVFVIAVLVQTIRLEGRFTLVAPVFFLLGLSFGLVGWKAAIFACIGVWTLNRVLPGVGFFLFVFAGLQVCFGLLLSRVPHLLLILAAGLTVLPVLLSAASKRRLVQLNKKSKTIRKVSASRA